MKRRLTSMLLAGAVLAPAGIVAARPAEADHRHYRGCGHRGYGYSRYDDYRPHRYGRRRSRNNLGRALLGAAVGYGVYRLIDSDRGRRHHDDDDD